LRLTTNKLLKATFLMAFLPVLVLGLTVAGCSSNSIATDTEGMASHQLQINLLGENHEFFLDNEGKLKSKVEVSAAQGEISLSLDKGTNVLDKDDGPLSAIRVAVDLNSPPPPQNAYIISSAYNIEPRGATFYPELSLTLRYDPGKLPEGIREGELYIAYCDGTEWYKPQYRRVDTTVHSVTTQLYDLTFISFAVLGSKRPAPSSTTQGTKIGNLAPDFQLYDLEGKSVSLSELRGKPVMLHFWATWCQHCVSEMPYFQQVHDEWSAKGLVLLAINIDGDPPQVTEFLDNNNLSLPVILAAKTDVASTYNIQYIPATFFIDKDGIIQFTKVGSFPTKEAIEGALDRIMP
jgi:peroxiredoxin